MIFTLFIDFTIALLLLITIIYAVRLNKRLATLHESRQQLQKLADDFTNSFAYAEKSIIGLQKIANEMSEKLNEQSKNALNLRDELAFLIERSEKIANEMEIKIRAARTPLSPQKELTPPFLKADPSNLPPSILNTTQENQSPEKISGTQAILRALKGMR